MAFRVTLKGIYEMEFKKQEFEDTVTLLLSTKTSAETSPEKPWSATMAWKQGFRSKSSVEPKTRGTICPCGQLWATYTEEKTPVTFD